LREVRQQARDSADEDVEQAEEGDAEEVSQVEETREDLLAGLQSQPEDEEFVPDWLAGLRGGEYEETVDDQPSREDQPDSQGQEPESSEKAPAKPLPGWVSDLGSPSEEVQGEESLGDWLASEVRKGMATEAKDESPLSSLGLDLQEDTEADFSSDPAPDEEVIQSDGDIPSWLKVEDLEGSSEGDGVGAKPLGEPALEETADDLKEEEPAPAGGESEIPDWLGTLQGDDDSASDPERTPEVEDTESSSDWPVLQEEGTAGVGVESDSDETSSEIPVGDELPDWLIAMEEEGAAGEPEISETQLPAEKEPVEKPPSQASDELKEAEETLEVSEVAPFAGEDLQLEGEADATSAFLETEDTAVSTEDVDAIFSMEMPDWLSEVETSADTSLLPDSGTGPESDDLRPADLPSWVQAMRPVEAFVSRGDQGAVGQPPEEKGPLAGLRGVLPLVPGVGPSSKPKTYSIKLQASEEQLASAELLEQMLEGEAYLAPVVTLPEIGSQRFLRMIIFLVLLLVVGFSLFSRTELNQIPLSVPSGTAQALTIVRDELLPDAAVLMIFDYEAAFATELEAVAAPLIDHMMVLKHPRLSLLASKPTGAGLSERFMGTTQPDQLYVNLGYLPGEAAGALAFVDNPRMIKPVSVDGQYAWETPMLQGVTGISDFAAIFLLTDEAETARIWIEQTQNKREATRLIVIASAQAGPLLLPYVESGQIDGMVTGLEGGGPIEQVNSGRPGKIRRYWDAFGFSLLVTILIISIGSMWSLFVGWQARRKKTGKA
jgi:hypothetical protein